MKVCLVIGDGPTRATDLLALERLGTQVDAVCCVNAAGLHHQEAFDYWYSYHADLLPEWAGARPGMYGKLLSCNTGGEFHGVEVHPLSNFETKGGSVIQAVRIMLRDFGFEQVILAGVPLSGRYERYHKAFTRFRDDHGSKVRALSGTTLDLFGAPEAVVKTTATGPKNKGRRATTSRRK